MLGFTKKLSVIKFWPLSPLRSHLTFSLLYAEAYILTKEAGAPDIGVCLVGASALLLPYDGRLRVRVELLSKALVKALVKPGDNITMEVALIAQIAMDEGLKFAIRERGTFHASVQCVVAGIIA